MGNKSSSTTREKDVPVWATDPQTEARVFQELMILPINVTSSYPSQRSPLVFEKIVYFIGKNNDGPVYTVSQIARLVVLTAFLDSFEVDDNASSAYHMQLGNILFPLHNSAEILVASLEVARTTEQTVVLNRISSLIHLAFKHLSGEQTEVLSQLVAFLLQSICRNVMDVVIVHKIADLLEIAQVETISALNTFSNCRLLMQSLLIILKSNAPTQIRILCVQRLCSIMVDCIEFSIRINSTDCFCLQGFLDEKENPDASEQLLQFLQADCGLPCAHAILSLLVSMASYPSAVHAKKLMGGTPGCFDVLIRFHQDIESNILSMAFQFQALPQQQNQETYRQKLVLMRLQLLRLILLLIEDVPENIDFLSKVSGSCEALLSSLVSLHDINYEITEILCKSIALLCKRDVMNQMKFSSSFSFPSVIIDVLDRYLLSQPAIVMSVCDILDSMTAMFVPGDSTKISSSDIADAVLSLSSSSVPVSGSVAATLMKAVIPSLSGPLILQCAGRCFLDNAFVCEKVVSLLIRLLDCYSKKEVCSATIVHVCKALTSFCRMETKVRQTILKLEKYSVSLLTALLQSSMDDIVTLKAIAEWIGEGEMVNLRSITGKAEINLTVDELREYCLLIDHIFDIIAKYFPKCYGLDQEQEITRECLELLCYSVAGGLLRDSSQLKKHLTDTIRYWQIIVELLGYFYRCNIHTCHADEGNEISSTIRSKELGIALLEGVFTIIYCFDWNKDLKQLNYLVGRLNFLQRCMQIIRVCHRYARLTSYGLTAMVCILETENEEIMNSIPSSLFVQGIFETLTFYTRSTENDWFTIDNSVVRVAMARRTKLTVQTPVELALRIMILSCSSNNDFINAVKANPECEFTLVSLLRAYHKDNKNVRVASDIMMTIGTLAEDESMANRFMAMDGIVESLAVVLQDTERRKNEQIIHGFCSTINTLSMPVEARVRLAAQRGIVDGLMEALKFYTKPNVVYVDMIVSNLRNLLSTSSNIVYFNHNDYITRWTIYLDIIRKYIDNEKLVQKICLALLVQFGNYLAAQESHLVEPLPSDFDHLMFIILKRALQNTSDPQHVLLVRINLRVMSLFYVINPQNNQPLKLNMFGESLEMLIDIVASFDDNATLHSAWVLLCTKSVWHGKRIEAIRSLISSKALLKHLVDRLKWCQTKNGKETPIDFLMSLLNTLYNLLQIDGDYDGIMEVFLKTKDGVSVLVDLLRDYLLLRRNVTDTSRCLPNQPNDQAVKIIFHVMARLAKKPDFSSSDINEHVMNIGKNNKGGKTLNMLPVNSALLQQQIIAIPDALPIFANVLKQWKKDSTMCKLVLDLFHLLLNAVNKDFLTNNDILQDRFLDQVKDGFGLLVEIMSAHNKAFQNGPLVSSTWVLIATLHSNYEGRCISSYTNAFNELRQDILRNYKNYPDLVNTVENVPPTLPMDKINEIIAANTGKRPELVSSNVPTVSSTKSSGTTPKALKASSSAASSSSIGSASNTLSSYLDRLTANKNDRGATLALCQQIASMLQRNTPEFPWSQMNRCCKLLVEALSTLYKDQEVARLILTLFIKLLQEVSDEKPSTTAATTDKKQQIDNGIVKRETREFMSQLISRYGRVLAQLLEVDAKVTEPIVPKFVLKLIQQLIDYNDKHHPSWALNSRYKSEGKRKGSTMEAADKFKGEISLFYAEGIEHTLLGIMKYACCIGRSTISADIWIPACQLMKQIIISARASIASINVDDLDHVMEFSFTAQRLFVAGLLSAVLRLFSIADETKTSRTKVQDAVAATANLLNQIVLRHWEEPSVEHQKYVPQHKEMFRQWLVKFSENLPAGLEGLQFRWLLDPVRNNFDSIYSTSEVFLTIIREVLSIQSTHHGVSNVTHASQWGLSFEDCMKLCIEILDYFNTDEPRMDDDCVVRRKDKMCHLACECIHLLVAVSDNGDIELVTRKFSVLNSSTSLALLEHLTALLQRVKDCCSSSSSNHRAKRHLRDEDAEIEEEENQKLVIKVSNVMISLFMFLRSHASMLFRSSSATNMTISDKGPTKPSAKKQDTTRPTSVQPVSSMLITMKKTFGLLFHMIRQYYDGYDENVPPECSVIGRSFTALGELCFYYQALTTGLVLLSKEDATCNIDWNTTTLTLSTSDSRLLIDIFIQCCEHHLEGDFMHNVPDNAIALEACKVVSLLCTDMIGMAVNGIASTAFTTKELMTPTITSAATPIGLNIATIRERLCSVIIANTNAALSARGSYCIGDEEGDLIELLTRTACLGQVEERVVCRISDTFYVLIFDKQNAKCMNVRNLIANVFEMWVGIWVYCAINHRHCASVLISVSRMLSFIIDSNDHTGYDVDVTKVRNAFHIKSDSDKQGHASVEMLLDELVYKCKVCHGEGSDAYQAVKMLCDQFLSIINQQLLASAVGLKGISIAKRSSTTSTATKANCSKVSHDTTLMSALLIRSDELELQHPLDVNVYKGIWRQCTAVAIKVCRAVSDGNKVSLAANQMQAEIERLVTLRHPRLVSLLGCCLDLVEVRGEEIVSGCASALVLEFMSKGGLRSVLDKEFFAMTMEEKLTIAVDICEGMRFLHASNVCHGELTSEKGVLIDGQGRAKLSGLWGKHIGRSDENNSVSGPLSADDKAKDVYDYGVILWQLITGKQRSAATAQSSCSTGNKKHGKKQVKKSKQLYVSEQERQQSSDVLIDWMHKCTNVSVANRPSFVELLVPLQALLAQQMKHEHGSHKAIPDGFLCPITQDVMKEPVILADGHSYERAAIVDWLCRSNRSPLTNEVLSSNALIENYALKSAITSYLSVDSGSSDAPPVVGREISSSNSCDNI